MRATEMRSEELCQKFVLLQRRIRAGPWPSGGRGSWGIVVEDRERVVKVDSSIPSDYGSDGGGIDDVEMSSTHTRCATDSDAAMLCAATTATLLSHGMRHVVLRRG